MLRFKNYVKMCEMCVKVVVNVLKSVKGVLGYMFFFSISCVLNISRPFNPKELTEVTYETGSA